VLTFRQLAGEKEVMAQVKLAFKDTHAARIVLTRSLQLTVKKGGAVTMKTLDSNLVIEKDGNRQSISHRAGDMNKPMIEYLGVSPAILDNVIFCHQDESLWPMSEPLTLKKRFDEIFDAQKYTKAIDNLKLLRKFHVAELGKFKLAEETEKINKDRGEKLLRRTEVLENVIKELNEKLDELNVEIEAAAAVKIQKRTEAVQASTAVEELRAKTEQARFVQKNIDDLKSYLDELQESDEWLESTLAQYDERMAHYKDQQKEYSAQYQDLHDSLDDLSQKMSRKQAEKGQHQAAKDNHEKDLENRLQLVKEAARRHGVRGYDGDLDTDQIQDFLSRMSKASKDKDRELERIKKTTSDEMQQAQTVISELKQREASQRQEKLHSRQGIDNNDKESRDKQLKLKSISMNEGTMAALETSRSDALQRLQRMDAESEAAAWDQNLKKEKARLSELRDESARLFEEISQNTKQSSARAQLDLAKKNAKEQQSSLDTMKATHNDDLISVVGYDWRVDSLEREFYAVVELRARDVTDSQRQREGVKDEYNGVEFQLKRAREEIRKKREDMKKCEAAVLASIISPEGAELSSIDDYPSELERIEVDRDGIKKEFDGADYSSIYFKSCLGFVQQHNACKLCTRKFADEKEKSTASQKLNALIQKVAKEQLQQDLDDIEADLRKANKARSQYDTYKAVQAELPTLDANLKKLEATKSSLLARLEKYDGILSEAETAKRDVEALTETVRAISRCSSDIAKHEADVNRLSSQQTLSGSSRSTEEIREQMAACEEQIRSLEAKINKLTSDKDQARTARYDVEKEVDAISSDLKSAQHELEKKQTLLSRIEELRENTSQLREAIRRADAELESLRPQVDKAQAQLEKVQQRGYIKEKEVQDDKNALSDTMNKLTMVESRISNYIEEGALAKLVSCERAIKGLEQERATVQSEVAILTERANELKERMADSEKTERSMRDNVRYRKYLRDLQALENEIAGLNSRNVTDDYRTLDREADKADKKHQNLLAQRGPIVGEIKGKDEQLAAYLMEWETDYAHAAARYREALINTTATKAVTEDVAKLTKAVDMAIMEYHKMKMEEINAIAGDLWQKTYQGTDIDTIMIRSEDDENATTTRASYKYRVVMVKQDTEMDMRGRCSAGQKVLACIIIRLALAECFGVNCGVSYASFACYLPMLIQFHRLSHLMNLPRISTKTISRRWPSPCTELFKLASIRLTSNSLSSLTTRSS